MKCPSCEGSELIAERPPIYRYAESGLPNVELHGSAVTIERCAKCGEEIVTIPRVAQLHRAIAEALATRPARLSPPEIRFLRKHLGFSGQDFAAAMGVGPATVSRWEQGHLRMGVSAERLLRLMALRNKPLEEYPNALLATLACDDAPTAATDINLRQTSSGWRREEAA